MTSDAFVEWMDSTSKGKELYEVIAAANTRLQDKLIGDAMLADEKAQEFISDTIWSELEELAWNAISTWMEFVLGPSSR